MTFFPIPDRFLRLLSGACAALSPTAMQRRTGILTMKIGYRLDMDNGDDTTRHKTVGQLEACFAAPTCSSCSHDVLCLSFSVPFHPFRTETNDHFIGVRASCAPIHWHIIISLSSSPSGMRYLTLAIHLRLYEDYSLFIILPIMFWAADHH